MNRRLPSSGKKERKSSNEKALFGFFGFWFSSKKKKENIKNMEGIFKDMKSTVTRPIHTIREM